MSFCFASGGHEDIVERMPNLVMQLGIIIFSARLGSILFEKLKIPGVLGELFIGIVISPYLLGAVPVPGFPNGIFGSSGHSFPIQPELYGISIVASIILLFLSGLETDINMFIKFSLAGTIIGISGIIFSFFTGALTAMYFLNISLFDPKCLFLGIMSTATSVGITARILSERKKTDTPEGVTIMAGAVIDDVLGVILLAIVMGISILSSSGSRISWSEIGILAFKEIGIWLGFTILGLYFAHKIGRFLKRFKNHVVFSILAFSFALVIAGLFERAGLAMIIGAYVVGFTLSKTEIRYKIEESLHPLKIFFVPIFFTVMGMMVDVRALFTKETLVFGLIYTIGAIVSKFIGCALPSLGLNFNWLGAKRIGLGMIPRGEVALIVAGIGLSYGFLNDNTYDLFSIAILMTLITTMISPPLLNFYLKSTRSGVKKKVSMPESELLELHLPEGYMNDLICHKLMDSFKDYGFFITQSEHEEGMYFLRKNETTLTIHQKKSILSIVSDKETSSLVKRILSRSILYLKVILKQLEETEKEMDLPESVIDCQCIEKIIHHENVCFLKNDSKEDAFWEILNLFDNHINKDIKKSLYFDLIKRENSFNSGYNHGIALPNLLSDKIDKPLLAIGISKKGIDFNATDGYLSHFIIVLISPSKSSNLHNQLINTVIDCSKQKDWLNLLPLLNSSQDFVSRIHQ